MVIGPAGKLVFALVGALLFAQRAEAFKPLITFDGPPSEGSLLLTPRWSAEPFIPAPGVPVLTGTGLHDGLHVCVAGGFAEALGATTPEQIAKVESATVAAFAAWQSPVLWFDIEFDCLTFGEIELGTFSDPGLPYFGLTSFLGVGGIPPIGTRVLTNGTSAFGYVLAGTQIGVNLARVLPFAATLPEAQQLAALQRLIMHEVGHAIGLDHPVGPLVFTTSRPNLDLDANPFNAMLIDWLAPFASFIASPNHDPEAIMVRGPPNLAALFYTELRNDDRAGRDTLYPLPPPDTDGDGVLDASDVCPLTPGAACTLAPGDLISSGFLTPVDAASGPQLLLLPPSGLARAVYTPSTGGYGALRAAAFAENVLVAAVPVTPPTPPAWELRIADLARGREQVVSTGLPRPYDIAVDAAGQIVVVFLSDPPAFTIVRIDPTNGASTPVGSGLGWVGALALDTDQASVIATVKTDAVTTIRRFAAGGGTTDLTSFSFVPGHDVAVEANGDVLFAAQLSPAGVGIHRLSRSTGQTALLADGFHTFRGLAVTDAGEIFVEFMDGALDERLDRIDPVTGARLPIPVSGFGANFDSAPALFAVPSFAPDPDADGVLGAADVCPYARNPDQRDSDARGGGDVCDACPLDPGDGCNAAQTAASSIDGAGGELTTPDGKVTVQVPAGALPTETSISITDTGTELELAGPSVVLRRVELGPEGEAFSAPVTVVLRWDDANGDGYVDQASPLFPPISESGVHLLRNGAPISQTCGASQHAPGICTTSCCDMVANRWTFQVSSFSEYRLEGGADPDYDGFATGSDNCPFVHDPTQADPGGVVVSVADGIGTACQCGDANATGVVDAADVLAIRQALAFVSLGLPSPGKCNVLGPVDPLVPLAAIAPRDCAIDDVVAIRRALAALPPSLGKDCAGAPNIP